MEFVIWDLLKRHGFVRHKDRGLWINDNWNVVFSQEYLDFMPVHIARSNIDMIVRLSVKAEITQKPYGLCLLNSDGSNAIVDFPLVYPDKNKEQDMYLFIGNSGITIRHI